MASGAGSPCGACKFLRRKCASDCIFAPYFNSDQGPARFAAIHKIFGASNVSKLLLHVPLPDRCEAVVTIAYEAQARIRDPVYGCVAHIFALQQQVAILEAQLMQLKAQLAHTIAGSQLSGDQWQGNIANPRLQAYSNMQTLYPKRSFDCVDYSSDGMVMQEMGSEEDLPTQHCTKRRAPHNELGELQALALRIMGS
ncbi:LOB domain-containing protein 16 [Elaeis guineensis]|uniref:LOB domain-containing protein 16 n=1 Tax=Elaeis guineensis var. tenera TaxID=51953 RepID=A0A6I9S0I0_ELAGV|nr:LOB domain-containing protein 16 [Elaeis guineensis]